jgi:hypothetical protein
MADNCILVELLATKLVTEIQNHLQKIVTFDSFLVAFIDD